MQNRHYKVKRCLFSQYIKAEILSLANIFVSLQKF